MCYGIVEKHSGTLSVNSELGQGTTFRLELPITNAKPETTAHSTEDTRSIRVLYIDDDSLVRESMVAVLDSFGHHVTTAKNGKDGVQLIAENQFDIVISDFSMPGMSGRGVATASKKIRPDLPVVLVTGWET